jgi:tetratricopeptide (TPR) repeat protein
LVLDNADDPTVDYQHYFPDGTLGVVLMTSRNPECQQYATVKSIPLEGLSNEDAEELLLRAASVPQDQYSLYAEDAAVVADLLRSHPFALIQAGAYVSRDRYTLPEYSKVFEQHREKLLTFHSVQGRSRYRDVYATFEASAEVLQSSQAEAEVDALQLLAVLAACGPNRLPLALFEAGWKDARYFSRNTDQQGTTQLSTWHLSRLLPLLQIGAAEWNSSRLTKAVHMLQSLSLVSTNDYDGVLSVSMHPLIHAWARDRQSMTEQHNSWIAAGCLFAMLDRDSAFWLKSRWQLRPHVQALTAWDISKMFASEPPRKVTTIVVACGWMLYRMRDDSKLFDLMCSLFNHLGLDPCTVHRKWADVYGLTASNFHNMVRIKEAVSLLEQLVKITEHLRDNHSKRLKFQFALAQAYLVDGQVKEAAALLEHVAKNREELAEDHPSRLASQHDLARAYKRIGRMGDAILLLEHVVKIRERLPEDDKNRLASQHTLARTYRQNGQIGEAVLLLRHVVKVQEQILTENHPDRLEAEHELARAYEKNGQDEDAIVLLEHVVKISEQTRAENHPDRLTAEGHLAAAYWACGRRKIALQMIRRVVEINRHVLDEHHPDRRTTEKWLDKMERVTNERENKTEIGKDTEQK